MVQVPSSSDHSFISKIFNWEKRKRISLKITKATGLEVPHPKF